MDLHNERQDWFLTQARVEEKPFTSQTPLIGSLIARLRTLWNNISTKWYVRSLLTQQNHYNQMVAQRLSDIDNRLIALDRQQAQLTHDVAELSTHLVQIKQLLQASHNQETNLHTDNSDQT